MDTKTGSNILLFAKNTPQPQRQTLPQSKGLGKGFPIRRDGEGYFILITGTIYQDEVLIQNIYAPNIKAPPYIKETLLELK